MDFCTAIKDKCANTACRRALTDQVERDAEKWWGGPDAPIAKSDRWHICRIRIAAEETKS
jgi:hypothetical protein